MIKLVVFDMAGTTVDEQNVVYKTLRKAINEVGYNFSLEEVLQYGAGKEKYQAISDILHRNGELPSQLKIDFVFKRFKELLARAYETLDVKPVEHAEEVFTYLKSKGIRIALNTGYDQQTAESLLLKLNWTEGVEFDTLITASQVRNNRPLPDMILLAMQRLGLSNAAEVAKVGDSTIDIQEGKNAGCGRTVGTTTGAHTFEQLMAAQPDHIISDLNALKYIF